MNKKWDEAKDEENPLYHDEEYQFYYNTPHPKYRTHSSWGMTDWNLIWSSRDFGSTNADPEGTERLVEDFSFPQGEGETEEVPPLGEAFVEMHPEDAADIDVENGDYVRITGKRGDLVVRVMVSERQRPRSAGDMGQLTLWHGWWPQQFPDDEEQGDGVKGYNVTTNIWLDPARRPTTSSTSPSSAIRTSPSTSRTTSSGRGPNSSTATKRPSGHRPARTGTTSWKSRSTRRPTGGRATHGRTS